jgi:hypothetical protein
MLLLTTPADFLELQTLSPVSTDWAVSYVDTNYTANTLIGGSAQGNITSAGTIQIVGSPPDANTRRQLKGLSVVNRDALLPQTVIIDKNSGGPANLTGPIVLSPGDSLQYIDTRGFSVLTAQGQEKFVGLPGPQGVPGPAGVTFFLEGDPGEDGASTPGAAGAPGAAGSPGPVGPAGQGPPGADGSDGEDGMPIPGPAGAPGPAGGLGPMGPAAYLDADPGEEGQPGPPGAGGPPGSIGLTGSPGPVGPAAFLEADSGEEGQPGAPGQAGAPGIAGAAGVPGPVGPAVYLEADAGEEGQPGTPGAAGPPGSIGAAGVTGPVGPAAFLEADAGEEGQPGAPGQVGSAGAAGAVGPAGPAIYLEADAGDQGDAGTPGAAGPVGPAGAPGVAGPSGFIALTDADPGDDGLPGAPGAAGATGVPGPNGPAVFLEADVLEGDAGAPGSPGPAGAPGATGAPGPSGYIALTDADPGDDGQIGPPGPAGQQGATGAQGPAGSGGGGSGFEIMYHEITFDDPWPQGVPYDVGPRDFTAPVRFCQGTLTTYPTIHIAGTNLTTPLAGVGEYDGTVKYFTPAASSRAVDLSEYFVCLAAAFTLTSQTAVQKLFNSTANGAITLPIGTYFFECEFNLTNLANSNSFGFALGGAATFTQGWTAIADKVALATPSAPLMSYNTAANLALTGALTTTTGYAKISGVIRVTVAGTVIPQISMQTASAAVVGINSFFKCRPAGNATVATVGNWS